MVNARKLVAVALYPDNGGTHRGVIHLAVRLGFGGRTNLATSDNQHFSGVM